MITTITHWTQQKLDQIMDIWLSSNKQAHPFVDPGYWESNRRQVREAIPQSELLAWTEGEKILAFLGLSGDWIAGLFVDASRRGQGIGHRLIEAAKKRHSYLGLAVYVKNKQAVSFYQREGFSVVEDRLDPSTGQLEWEMEWNIES